MEFFNIESGLSLANFDNMRGGLTRRKAIKLSRQTGGYMKRNGFRDWSVHWNNKSNDLSL